MPPRQAPPSLQRLRQSRMPVVLPPSATAAAAMMTPPPIMAPPMTASPMTARPMTAPPSPAAASMTAPPVLTPTVAATSRTSTAAHALKLQRLCHGARAIAAAEPRHARERPRTSAPTRVSRQWREPATSCRAARLGRRAVLRLGRADERNAARESQARAFSLQMGDAARPSRPRAAVCGTGQRAILDPPRPKQEREGRNPFHGNTGTGEDERDQNWRRRSRPRPRTPGMRRLRAPWRRRGGARPVAAARSFAARMQPFRLTETAAAEMPRPLTLRALWRRSVRARRAQGGARPPAAARNFAAKLQPSLLTALRQPPREAWPHPRGRHGERARAVSAHLRRAHSGSDRELRAAQRRC